MGIDDDARLLCSTPCHLSMSCGRFRRDGGPNTVGFHPDLEDGSCSMWILRPELQTEGLRDNPKNYLGMSPSSQAKHMIKKGESRRRRRNYP
jgi:hypothetical protein